MKSIKWWIAAPGAVMVVAAAVLLQTASAADVIYTASNGAHLTGAQASSRLTTAVAGVWVGPLSTLKKIACAKQATDPVTWVCDHKGNGEAEFSVYRTARAEAATDPLRSVRMTSRIPGTTRVGYYQTIRAIYTPPQMAGRYTGAVAGIWRGSIGTITGVRMVYTGTTGTPYTLWAYGLLSAPESDYLDQFEAAESDPLQTCEDVADVVEE